MRIIWLLFLFSPLIAACSQGEANEGLGRAAEWASVSASSNAESDIAFCIIEVDARHEELIQNRAFLSRNTFCAWLSEDRAMFVKPNFDDEACEFRGSDLPPRLNQFSGRVIQELEMGERLPQQCGPFSVNEVTDLDSDVHFLNLKKQTDYKSICFRGLSDTKSVTGIYALVGSFERTALYDVAAVFSDADEAAVFFHVPYPPKDENLYQLMLDHVDGRREYVEGVELSSCSD